MFTGIITDTGTVWSLDRRAGVTRLGIRSEGLSRTAERGDSISVNGVCLTVTSIERGVMLFDLSAETLGSTNLGSLKRGERVNLEPALRAMDRLGGHFVTGHIDGVGRIRQKRGAGETREFVISAPPEVMRYVVKKGSIAVDGISLTVVEADEESFKVVIIPHTERATTLGQKGVGDTVNLEADIIGKYVERFLSSRREQGLEKKLEAFGFK